MPVHRALVAEVAVARGAAEERIVDGGVLEMLIKRGLVREFTVAGGAVEVGGAFCRVVSWHGGDGDGLRHGLAPVSVKTVLGQ